MIENHVMILLPLSDLGPKPIWARNFDIQNNLEPFLLNLTKTLFYLPFRRLINVNILIYLKILQGKYIYIKKNRFNLV